MMQTHFGTQLFQAEWPQSVVCIGTFDGVHRGHQAVIRQAVEKGRKIGQPCVLATFDRHPASILAPEKCPLGLASLQCNIREFETLGVAVAVILAFDKQLSETSADQFFEQFILGRFHASSIVVGHDFTFGKGREGTPDWLRGRIETEEVAPVLVDGLRVSSSQIRSAIEKGEVDLAARFLARPFEISGIVVGGQKLGRTLGYPTVNLGRSFKQVTPADGVYSGECDTVLGRFKAAISIGVRPSIDSERTIEAHLLDYPGQEIYGTPVQLHVHKRLREQLKFADLEDLKKQMASDVAQASHVV